MAVHLPADGVGVILHVDGSVLLEAERDIGEGTSKANSAIVHTGFDAKAGTLEAVMLRRAGALWPDLVDELEVGEMRGRGVGARDGDAAIH